MTKVISDKSLLKSYSESDAKSNKSLLELASNNFDTFLKEAFFWQSSKSVSDKCQLERYQL